MRGTLREEGSPERGKLAGEKTALGMKRRYDLFYTLGTLIAGPVLAYDLIRTGKWRTDWRGRFGKAVPLPEDSRPTLLLHGVSVGEINATRELVDHLTAPDAPPLRLVVSATTNTGFARAQELYGHRLPVVRFPFDFSWMVKRFLDAVRPDAVVLMELELWPNLAQICNARGIPLAVLNGRLSHESFRHYRWVRPLVRPMFRALDAVGVQTREYAERFQALGVPEDRITVTDTMKWDPVRLVDRVEGARELGEAMGIHPDRPLVVAGSTGPGEEALLLAGKPPGVQLLLVPRKPERFQEVAELAPGVARRSERVDGWRGGGQAVGEDLPEAPSASGASQGVSAPAAPGPGGPPEVFLLDTMGELTRAYSLADVAVVGRSFVPMGGSDPIEAIALGKPTVMGPHHDNFRGVVEAFKSADAIRITSEPWPEVNRLLEDPEARRALGARGREVIRERKGATARNAALLQGLLRRKEAGAFAPKSPSRRLRRWILGVFLAYMAAGYLTTLVDRVPGLADPEPGGALDSAGDPAIPLPQLDGALWSGVFSVHTDRSHDARGTREDVARAAEEAGLDFVVIGDHPPDDRKPGWTFWDPVILEGVLMEGGQELRSPEAGKILAVGVDTTYKRWTGDYTSFARMLDRNDATAFVVHGRGPRGSERWVNPDARGIQGWEVLDISEFARHRLRSPWSVYHLLTLLLGTPVGLGDEALLHLVREGFQTPTIAAYDSLRMTEPLTATAGLNSHPKLRIGSLLLPSYGPAFRSLVTHVAVDSRTASGETPEGPPAGEGLGPRGSEGISGGPEPEDMTPARASALLMDGARRGNVFISLGRHPAAAAFRMGAVANGGEILASMGGEVPYRRGLALRAGFLEEPGRRILYRVMRNGESLGWRQGPELVWPLEEPGVYRVEVYAYWARMGTVVFHLRPWIFGNPLTFR